LGGIFGRGRDFCGPDLARTLVEQNDVRESPAYIDSDAPHTSSKYQTSLTSETFHVYFDSALAVNPLPIIRISGGRRSLERAAGDREPLNPNEIALFCSAKNISVLIADVRP
jgi:hypothetical protein